MTHATSTQPSWSFGSADLLDLFFAPTQQSASPPIQDADLLRSFSFIPGLKEFLMLRQVHALEHATVWVLSSRARRYRSEAISSTSIDNGLLGGMSTDRGFYLYGTVDVGELNRAVQTALRRITAGEWDLAVHPRCGTNLSVGLLLTAGLAIGASAVLPRGPIEQLVGLGLAAATAAHLAPDFGSFAQRYLTTAIPFNLAIDRITTSADHLGRPTHFIQVRWID